MTRSARAIPWALPCGALLLLAAAPSAPDVRFTDVARAAIDGTLDPLAWAAV